MKRLGTDTANALVSCSFRPSVVGADAVASLQRGVLEALNGTANVILRMHLWNTLTVVPI